MHWRPDPDRPSPVTSTSWRSIALATILFVLGPIAITVTVSQPAVAVGLVVTIALVRVGRALSVNTSWRHDRPHPKGRSS